MDRCTAWAEIDSILESMDPNRSSWICLLHQQQQQQQQPQSLKSQLSSHEQASLCQSVVPLSMGTRSRNSRVEVPENAAAARSSAAIVLMDFFVSLEDWAVLNRLEEVVPVLLNFGFDCASFINDVITEDDLHEMGIQCPGERRHILVAVLDLPKGIETVAASLSASATVETFMQRLCLQQYLATNFSELRHCLVDCLAGVTDSELNVKYGICHLGHRRRILRCLSRLTLRSSPDSLPSQPQQHSNRLTCSSGIKAEENKGNSGNSLDQFVSIANSTPAAEPTPPRQTNCCNKLLPEQKHQKRRIRKSQELLLTERIFQPNLRPGWPHHPQVLLGGRAAYSVSYLGFRPVKDHTDRGEVDCHMRNFRRKSADILKLPQICLSISCMGVKFVNPDNEIFITEHRITDIYFVCQDSSLRTNFAYIIKDSSGGTHYCHCFASHSPDAAVLIINTLQEACSLADQLIEFNTGCCGISRSDGASS